jgi:hypothetical protein
LREQFLRLLDTQIDDQDVIESGRSWNGYRLNPHLVPQSLSVLEGQTPTNGMRVSRLQGSNFTSRHDPH